MNASGLQRDVQSLLHETGHAFHTLEAWDHVDVTFACGAPKEFSEVASMAMELMAAGAYDEFYAPSDAARAWQSTLEWVVRLLPWIATVDGFQHWLYTHPQHTREERTACWLALLERFGSRRVSWIGFEEVRAASWQRLPHFFSWPFNYVEYGIAQLGALHLWLQYRENPAKALEYYRRALALGGTRPLPDLFAAAGIPFDFSGQAVAPLVGAVRQELARLSFSAT
jgi:oligoendopeptidase F